MRIPHTIPKTTFEAYRCSSETISLPREQNRTLRGENEFWNENIVPELKVLSLKVIVQEWEKNSILQDLPTSEDRDHLLELLPTNLPIKLIIKEIPYEYYWERASKARWEFNNLVEHGNSWRQLYCERHFAEYLESLDITYFDVEQEACEEVIQLLRDFIYTIKIHCLVATEYPLKLAEKENDDESRTETDFPVQHIPMNMILPKLSKLRELVINFGMIYFNDGFEWKDFQFSVEDCRNLGRGIRDCFSLKKFALTKSNLDQPRVAALLQEMTVNNSVEEIDFSHCKLEDNGAQAIGLFLTMHKHLKVLHLANNKIGPVGVAGIVYGLLEEHSVPLKHLNLRLNPLQNEGGMHICSILLKHARLEVLNISGCGLGPETGIGMAEVIASGHMKCSSLELDVSNNNFGPIAGVRFDESLKICPLIVAFDSRLCNFNYETLFSISQTVFRNKTQKGKNEGKMFLSTASSIGSISSLILKAKNLLPSKYYHTRAESSSGNEDKNEQDEDYEENEDEEEEEADGDNAETEDGKNDEKNEDDKNNEKHGDYKIGEKTDGKTDGKNYDKNHEENEEDDVDETEGDDDKFENEAYNDSDFRKPSVKSIL